MQVVIESMGIFTWEKLIKDWSSSTPVWLDGVELALPLHLRSTWLSVSQELSLKGFRRRGNRDQLVWATNNSSQQVRVKDIYNRLITDPPLAVADVFPMSLWKVPGPLKCTLFTWLVYFNRNLSWEVLQRRGWNGPGRCALCLSDLESNSHMFFQCQQARNIWYELSLSFSFPYHVFSSVQEGFTWWSAQCTSLRSIFVSVLWGIWRWRNNCIFNNHRPPLASILLQITEPVALPVP